MSKSNLQNDVIELLSDVREQIQYLQEIGVESLDADLPEISLSPKSKVQSPKPENKVSQERLEKFVPSEDILKQVAEKAPTIEKREPPKSRRGLLESTKLSRLPSIPKRNSIASPSVFQNKKNKQDSTEKEMAKETTLTESLFGDISETLPEAKETIDEIRADIGDCTRCPLHSGRTNIVHSHGNFQSDLMFIGEAPGADEDAQGLPFVGRAGKLLTKIIEGIGLKREDVIIGNINRCRPPANRQPTTEESETCKPFLIREISIIRPKVIVVMGNTAMKNLLDTKQGITKMRGNFVDYYGVKVMPTFHPAYLLRDPRKKTRSMGRYEKGA